MAPSSSSAYAGLGAFGDNACVYLRDGVAYKSGHELENAVFGDNATKFWPRLSRSPAYDASLRPQAWLEGRLDAGPDVVSYNFQLRYFELKEKESAHDRGLRALVVRMAGPTIDYTNAATASGDVFSNQWRIVDASVAVYSTSYDGVPYSELHQRARFARKHKYYVSEAMFPALFFLVISYCGFWLDRTVAPARVAIAVIPVLIMRTLVNGAFSNIQVISYNTFLTASLHLGEAMCIIAVFEYAVVQYLLAREKRALAAHGRYAANRAPIARACATRRDAPLAVRAAAARLRGLSSRASPATTAWSTPRGSGASRARLAAPSVGEIAAMVDMARRGATTLDVAGAVDFVLAYDEVCCAGVAAGRGVVDMPPSEQLDVAFRVAFPVVGVLLLLTQVVAHRDEGPAGALFEDSSFNDPLFFSWTPFFAAPTAVAPEGWGSTVGEIVDAGEDPATPI
ncbi:GABA-A receptor [Aureococcus anophagefferens]|uniref:GABA-A receptor n=1 Tax=Aureococcus anophagefferens TaxID=44056 RepID=A0ABR1FK22_AURAN